MYFDKLNITTDKLDSLNDNKIKVCFNIAHTSYIPKTPYM